MTLLTVILQCSTGGLDCNFSTVSPLQNSLTLFCPFPPGNKNLVFTYLILSFLKTLMCLNIRRDYISFLAVNTSQHHIKLWNIGAVPETGQDFPFKKVKIQTQNSLSSFNVPLTIRLHKRQQFCANIPGSKKVCFQCDLSLDCKWSSVIDWSWQVGKEKKITKN